MGVVFSPGGVLNPPACTGDDQITDAKTLERIVETSHVRVTVVAFERQGGEVEIQYLESLADRVRVSGINRFLTGSSIRVELYPILAFGVASSRVESSEADGRRKIRRESLFACESRGPVKVQPNRITSIAVFAIDPDSKAILAQIQTVES